MEIRYIISLEPQYDDEYNYDDDDDDAREPDRWTVRASAFIYHEEDSDTYSVTRTVQNAGLAEYVRAVGLPLSGLLPASIARYLQNCIAGEISDTSIVHLDVRFQMA